MAPALVRSQKNRSDSMSPQECGDDRSDGNSESICGGDTDFDALGSSLGDSCASVTKSLSLQEERSLDQLQDALDCLVGNASDSSRRLEILHNKSDLDCSSYLTACKTCPSIVQNPSFRIPFLRRFNMDPWAAANRLVAYWKERELLFGEAAFRPLTISSLPQLFQEGSIVLLPHRDKEGRSVIFLDRQKLNYEQLRDDKGRAQCLFYILDLAAQQNPSASTEGVVILALVCKPPKYETVAKGKDISWWDSFFQSFSNLYEWKFPKHCIRMTTKALPVQVAMIHFCTMPQSTGVGYLRTAAVKVCLTMVGSYYSDITKVHHGGKQAEDPSTDNDLHESHDEGLDQFSRLSQASLLRQLRPYGLYKRQLPEVMGGLFTSQNFEHWIQRQMNQEMRNYATKEELLKRKRQVNLIHSRQKRLRRRQEFDELNNQSEFLKAENQRARTEASRLEALLHQANEIIKQVETDPSNILFTTVGAGSQATMTNTVGCFDAANLHAVGSHRSTFHHAKVDPLPHVPSPGPPCFNGGIDLFDPQRTAVNSLPLGEVTDVTSPQTTPMPMFQEATSPLLSFSNLVPISSINDVNAIFNADRSIPSAADLCQGFSGLEERDPRFSDLLPNLTDPHPTSLWSSMLGLFRPQATTHLFSDSSRNHVVGYSQEMGMRNPWQEHGSMAANVSAPSSILSQEPNVLSSTTPPPIPTTDGTDPSSPASRSSIKPAEITSLSPVDADWYSW